MKMSRSEPSTEKEVAFEVRTDWDKAIVPCGPGQMEIFPSVSDSSLPSLNSPESSPALFCGDGGICQLLPSFLVLKIETTLQLS